MKKIYIDITQLYNWHGKVTGIQRVMDEISRRFIGDQRFDPTFLVWQKNTASFYEVNYEDVPYEKERKNISVTTVQSGISKTTRLSKLRKYGSKIYYRVPVVRKLYGISSLFNRKVLNAVGNNNSIELDEDSILFMPHGGVWESDVYISRIITLKKTKGVKLVPILFDTVPVLTPQFAVEAITVVFGNYMKAILPIADLILSISENTANDAKKWLSDTSGDMNIKVFRLGDEVGNDAQIPVDVPSKYALCVGTIEVRKNHTILYYAYKQAFSKNLDMPVMVIVGRRGWMSEDVYHLITSDPETKDKFIFLHDSSDGELAWLYEHALFTVYPSFYEGWGLPIAESLLRKTPCLASNTSSMPEIAGDIIEYFSPSSSDELMVKINNYTANPEKLSELRQKTKKYKSTSWDKTFEEVSGYIYSLE